MIHTTVYREEGIYAGWPANHGAWQWENEFLVGFMRGTYVSEREGQYGHKIARPFEKVLARSLDGGRNWSVEIPNQDFEATTIKEPPSFSFDENIIRCCGVYDTGGEECDRRGGFYLSNDHGKSWTGAFAFRGLERIFDGKERQCTSRTCTLGNLLFLSVADTLFWGTDSIVCVKHDGNSFNIVSAIPSGLRSVMPAAASVGSHIVTCIRRMTDHCFIDAFGSNDRGYSWQFLSKVGLTGKNNGNPPALISHNGKLFCAYGNRSLKSIMLSVSSDYGKNWKEFVLRGKGKTDIGYPRLFVRDDSDIVCVYYWSEEGTQDCQGIEATEFGYDEFV